MELDHFSVFYLLYRQISGQIWAYHMTHAPLTIPLKNNLNTETKNKNETKANQKKKNILTLKCLSYFSLPFVRNGGGGSTWTPFWVFSRKNFGSELAPYVYAPKPTIYLQK